MRTFVRTTGCFSMFAAKFLAPRAGPDFRITDELCSTVLSHASAYSLPCGPDGWCALALLVFVFVSFQSISVSPFGVCSGFIFDFCVVRSGTARRVCLLEVRALVLCPPRRKIRPARLGQGVLSKTSDVHVSAGLVCFFPTSKTGLPHLQFD